MISKIAKKVPLKLRSVSGSVFYTGRAAYAGKAQVYILGANPGGDPDEQSSETIQGHTDFVLNQAPDLWSAYCDECWTGRPVGQAPLQRRVQHLLSKLGLDTRQVPASNVVFSRSRRIEHLAGDYHQLAELCWPVHDAVLNNLQPKAVICFGEKAATEVKIRTGATLQIDKFVEQNGRKWTSSAWHSASGLIVFQLTHPAVADWISPDTDPSDMVSRVLANY